MRRIGWIVLLALLSFTMVACEKKESITDESWYWFVARNTDGKYGFFDENGNEALPFIYDKAAPFMGGLSIVKIGDLYGVINPKGEYVINLEYSLIKSLDEDLFFIVTEASGELAIYDTEGTRILAYEGATGYHGTRIEGLFSVTVDGLCGLADTDGNTIVEPIYDSISVFTDERAYVEKNGKINYIDTAGNKILSEDADTGTSFMNGFASIKRGQLWYAIDVDGELLFERSSTETYYFSEAGVSLFFEDSLYGLIDSSGTVLEPAQYMMVTSNRNREDFTQNFYQYGDSYYIFNTDGSVAFESDTFHITGFSEDRIIAFDSNNENTMTVLDYDGHIIMTAEEDSLFFLYDGYTRDYVIAEHTGLEGNAQVYKYYDKDGNLLTPVSVAMIYRNYYSSDDIYIRDTDMTDSYAELRRFDGTLIAELPYKFAYIYHDFIYLMNNNLYGIMNLQGDVIIPLEYEYIFSLGFVVHIDSFIATTEQ